MNRNLLTVQIHAAGYGNHPVLRNISLTASAGQIVTLLGANGSGKSTLVRAISGLIRYSGSVIFNDENLSGMRPETIARRGIIQVPEGRGTIAPLTVYENLQIGAYRRRSRAEINCDLDRVYSLFPRLKERQHQQAGLLSGGEQQMLAIGRALMSAPEFLILDEPSIGLAPAVIEQIFDALVQIKTDRKLGILLVEQNARMALSISERGYVLDEGRIRLSGLGETLLQDETIISAYFGALENEPE